MAESLQATDDAPLPAQRLAPASPGAVARSLAQLACPVLANDGPPSWLRPAQVAPWRRLLGAVRQYRGAMLAEAPGSGKTWMALAAAKALARQRVTCLVPAVVQGQWTMAAARAGLAIDIGTHEQASRGRLPWLNPLVIVDESHQYRNPHIKRYDTVARCLVGRQVILLSGSPVVNRLEDLLHQLALVVRDDVLAVHGVPSLRSLRQADRLPEAIARLVIRSPETPGLPVADLVRVRFQSSRPMSGVIREVRRLTVSQDRGVRMLVQGVLLRSAASSPAALLASLRRYSCLLANHADAARFGCAVSRDDLRRWAGATGEQTALWPMVAAGGEPVLLCDSDHTRVRALLGRLTSFTPGGDPKASRLLTLLGDGRRTLVFTVARETVAWLRRAIGYHRVAWCSGEGAGIGMARWPRHEIFKLYGPESVGIVPSVLISTDVAAEGLDLQRIERVVHYDLPWTPARLAQRVGRAARLGSVVPRVRVVRFDPPARLERLIRSAETLERKLTLPERAQLANAALAGWPATLAAGSGAFRQGQPAAAWLTQTSLQGLLVGLEITGLDSHGRVVRGGRLLWIQSQGARADVATIREPLLAALAAPQSGTADAVLPRTVLEQADAAAAELLRSLNGQAWDTTRRSHLNGLLERLRHIRRRAVADRDATTVGIVSSVMQLASGGCTAGEALMLKDLARSSGRAALRTMALLPAARPIQRFEVRVAGLVVFGDGKAGDTAGRPEDGKTGRREGRTSRA